MKVNEIILEHKLNEDILNEVSWIDVKKAIVGGLISLTALGVTDVTAKDIGQMSPDEVKQELTTKVDTGKLVKAIQGNASTINAEIANDLATSGGPVTFKGPRGSNFEILSIKTVDNVTKDWKKSKLVTLVKWNHGGGPATYHIYGSAGWGVGSELQGVETAFDDLGSANGTYQKITPKNIGKSFNVNQSSPVYGSSMNAWNYFSNIAGPMVSK